VRVVGQNACASWWMAAEGCMRMMLKPLDGNALMESAAVAPARTGAIAGDPYRTVGAAIGPSQPSAVRGA